MANPFTSPVISGYNPSPPPDDGSTVASNLATWADLKSELVDPVKALVETAITNTSTGFGKIFGNNISTVSGGYSVVAGDQGKLLNCTASLTLTLLAAATAGSNFTISVRNGSSGTVTLDGNGAETINGSATWLLAAEDSLILICNGSNWFTIEGTGKPPIGVILDYGSSSVPNGYLECDGSAVSRTTYSRLFTAISTTWGTGDGSTTFNIPDFRGRSTIGAGTGSLAESTAAADVDTGNDTFLVVSNTDKWITGMAVQLTTTGALPTGLSLATTYYVIRNSATTIKFATSLANAVAGTTIDITAIGSGVHTTTHTLTARTLGGKLGEETHASDPAEIPAHNHGYSDPGHTHTTLNTDASGVNSVTRYTPLGGSTVLTSGAANNTWVSQSASTGITISSFGSSNAHNNMPPSVVATKMIRAF